MSWWQIPIIIVSSGVILGALLIYGPKALWDGLRGRHG